MLTGCKVYKEKEAVTTIIDQLRTIPYLPASNKQKLLQLNFPLYLAFDYSFPSLSLKVSKVRFLINPPLLNMTNFYTFSQEYQRGIWLILLSKSLLLLAASIVTLNGFDPIPLPTLLSIVPDDITSLHPSDYNELKIFIEQNEGKKVGDSYIFTTKYIPALEEYIAYCEKMLNYWKPSLLFHFSTINENDIFDSLEDGDSISLNTNPICVVTLNYNKLLYSAGCMRAKPSIFK